MLAQDTARLLLIVKVARLYHEQGLRQPEIAERLNMSQSRVSRLLKEGVEAGVIRTSVVEPDGLCSDLELEVQERFGLRDVVVAAVTPEIAVNEPLLLSAIGGVGARYLEATLLPDDQIGLSSWSASLLATVGAMSPGRSTSASSVVQLLGGVGDPRAQVQATRLAERLGQVTGADVTYFPAPGVVATKQVRDSLFTEPAIAQVRRQWESLTVALVGIGTAQPSSLLVSSGNTLAESDLRLLARKGGVGDVCLNFFDSEGRAVTSEVHDRVLGIDGAALKAIPRRIGIAGGPRKLAAIRGALLGGWCDVLFTDSVTAKSLVA